MTLRRSSTSRSIGARSDWDNSTTGEEREELARAGSVGIMDEETLRRKAEVEERVAQYVSSQLERVRSNDPAIVQDELEAQLDGQ